MKTSAALILIVMSAAISSQAFAQGNSTRTQRFSDGIYTMPASREKASKGSGASSDAVKSLQDETLASELFVSDSAPKTDSVKVTLADAISRDPSWYNDSFYYGPSWYRPWYWNPYFYNRWFYGYSFYPYSYWGGPYYGSWAAYYDPWLYDPWRYDYAWYGPWYGPYYGPYFTPYGHTYHHEYHHGGGRYEGYTVASRDSRSSGQGMNSAGGRLSAGPRGASRVSEGSAASRSTAKPPPGAKSTLPPAPPSPPRAS